MNKSFRNRVHEIIFEADTPAGKAFDVALLWGILISVSTVLLDSIPSLHSWMGDELRIVEWIFTILFTIEFLLRLISVQRPLSYLFSFFGIVDLLSILPTYLSLFIPGSETFLVVRILRLLRLFRVLKLVRYLSEAQVLVKALKASQPKITVFLGTVFTLMIIMGALMHLVEGPEHGFTSIPISIYWAVVTLTTVGYGDIVPHTPLGKAIASMLMILGYGVIAVPTGIVSVELSNASKGSVSTQVCPRCAHEGHDSDAVHCKFCGTELNPG